MRTYLIEAGVALAAAAARSTRSARRNKARDSNCCWMNIQRQVSSWVMSAAWRHPVHATDR